MTRDHSEEWTVPPLAADDERLVDAYVRTGKSLDDLAYSDEFEALFRSLNKVDSLDEKHAVFRRLLTLRKQGRLPRIYATAS